MVAAGMDALTGTEASRLGPAEIIAVGTELLVPPRLDTNSLFITERLNDIGVEVRARTVVGDCREDLEAIIRDTIRRTKLVVLCGGLGPTDDDLTRDAAAAVLSLPLEEQPAIIEGIRRRFAARGARMPERNRRQAMVPAGALVLPNEWGTAPGLWIEHGGRILVLLPGPPAELEPMFDRVVSDRLAPLAGSDRLHRRVLRISGRTESEVDEAASPIYSTWLSGATPVVTTILSSPGEIELRLSTRSASAQDAQSRLDAAVGQLVAALGADVFSTDGRAIEEVVGHLLRERRWRIAAAESCTGGMISARLTDVAGSSDYVGLNAVCYSNAAKISLLGVRPEILDGHGAVSEPVALAMADGIRRQSGAEIGIGVTGIAGPGGGTDRKPAGTVVIGVTTADTRLVRTFRFPSGRARVRRYATQLALDLARRVLLGQEPGGAFVYNAPSDDR
jgi:nicotinamide-nucleotide amidase